MNRADRSTIRRPTSRPPGIRNPGQFSCAKARVLRLRFRWHGHTAKLKSTGKNFSLSIAPSSPAIRGAWLANFSARCWCARAASCFWRPASSRSKLISEKTIPPSHSAAGNTARTAVLFGPPGYAYVYFIYGNHYCLNVSCERDGKAGGVLFRAVEPLRGIEEMARARKIEVQRPSRSYSPHQRPRTPGRSLRHHPRPRQRRRSDFASILGLWIGDDGFRARNIQITPRIGISKAADSALRYILAGNPFVSGQETSPPEAKDRTRQI